MKADLTRDTFHHLKHFGRVLMQQGRVQLDADWNEQAAISAHYLHRLMADLIGPAGSPGPDPGFQISPLSGSTAADFQIGFGDYYVDGLLCQADSIPLAFFPTSTANLFQLMNWSSDFERATIPYFEVFDDTPGTTNHPVPVMISNPQKSSNQVKIVPSTGGNFRAFSNPKLRRWITYLHQPDYVFSITPGAISPPPLPTGDLQIYLDVWERVITYAEDDSIREVALGGPDTAARGKRVWQVKSCPAVKNADGATTCMTFQQLYQQFQPANRGWLQAIAKQSTPSTDPCIINPNASYTGRENQLYRVEINRAGQAGTDPVNSATFKWSRENGSVFFPIVNGGGTSMVVVENLGRDDRFGLSEGDLVEVQDDRSVLLNNPGNLLAVKSIDPGTRTVTLAGSVDPNIGSDSSLNPLLRRWDQTAGDQAGGGLTLANDNAALLREGTWLTLEDGVQIQFQPASSASPPAGIHTANQYLTGDYWLIPARTATGDVEWPRVLDPHSKPEVDAQGNAIPIALPPQGVTHHYAPLAVVTVAATGVTVDHECRGLFNVVTAALKCSDRL